VCVCVRRSPPPSGLSPPASILMKVVFPVPADTNNAINFKKYGSRKGQVGLAEHCYPAPIPDASRQAKKCCYCSSSSPGQEPVLKPTESTELNQKRDCLSLSLGLPFSPSITMISESVNSPLLISSENSPIVFPISGY